ncbi:MAG: hypothetical protein R2771_10885 [Saprospiraceae bacterium]
MKYIQFFILLLIVNSGFSQSSHQLKLKADKLYGDSKYSDAEVYYKKSDEKTPDFISNYNAGNAFISKIDWMRLWNIMKNL